MSSTSIETELTVYILMEDGSDLSDTNDIEDHIQLEGILTTAGKVRVRKTIPIKGSNLGQGDSYVLTFKDKRKDESGVPSGFESNIDVDRNAFEAYGEIAERAVLKRRYTFDSRKPEITGVDQNIVLPAVQFQVDQFINPNTSQRTNWVKLDIELQDLLKAMKEQGLDVANVKQRFVLSDLPFKSAEIINPTNMTPEQEQKLGHLWETEFSKKLNPEKYIKAPAS